MGEESQPLGQRDIVKLILIIVFQTIILTALGIVFRKMFFVRQNILGTFWVQYGHRRSKQYSALFRVVKLNQSLLTIILLILVALFLFIVRGFALGRRHCLNEIVLISTKTNRVPQLSTLHATNLISQIANAKSRTTVRDGRYLFTAKVVIILI